jgi:hypothetical protein
LPLAAVIRDKRKTDATANVDRPSVSSLATITKPTGPSQHEKTHACGALELICDGLSAT